MGLDNQQWRWKINGGLFLETFFLNAFWNENCIMTCNQHKEGEPRKKLKGRKKGFYSFFEEGWGWFGLTQKNP